MKEWKLIQKAKDKKKDEKQRSWLETMTVPCRRCSDLAEDGKEVWKPIESFVMDRTHEAIWDKVLSKGQDALCHECRRAMGSEDTQCSICCQECGIVKTKDKFSAKDLQLWQSLDTHPIACLACQDAKFRRSESLFIQCNGQLCLPLQKEVPEYHFLDDMLNEWKEKGTTVMLQCARCYVRSPSYTGPKSPWKCKFKCVGCSKDKAFVEASPVTLKEWLSGKRMQFRWRCYTCQYPMCAGKDCGRQAQSAVPHNAWENGKYYCEFCRYPSCKHLIHGKECGKRRQNPGSTKNGNLYMS